MPMMQGCSTPAPRRRPFVGPPDRALVSLLAAACLGGCGHPAPVDRATVIARAATLLPADPHVADLYQHACRACHVVATSAAPLTGDRDAWRERSKKGLRALVDSTVGGFRGMPAGGQCARCTVADYEALIRFMAGEVQ